MLPGLELPVEPLHAAVLLPVHPPRPAAAGETLQVNDLRLRHVQAVIASLRRSSTQVFGIHCNFLFVVDNTDPHLLVAFLFRHPRLCWV